VKTIVAILILSSYAIGQDNAAVTAAEAACGPRDLNFEVKADVSRHPTPSPENGKALIYFVAEGSLTSMLGLDGKWVGAVNGGMYFFIPIEPGEHHLCALDQKGVLQIGSRRPSLHSLKAEPGASYYFVTRLTAIGWQGTAFVLELYPLDPDEGRALVARAKFSTSHAK